jgi:phage recombination protein Bet
MAQHYGMNKDAFVATVKKTVMPSNQEVSNEQLAAFCLVAKQYNLNPFTKEIFAFPSRGGIQPVVSVDGWMKLINSHPDFDGMSFEDRLNDEGQLISVTCRMYRKSRSHPVEVIEYMSECRRATDTWKQWPARMLRHKAAIQAARYAFSFAGIVEPDEAERASEAHESETAIPIKLIEDERKQRCDEAYDQYMPSVDLIKEKIKEWDESQEDDCLYTVAETWRSLPQSAQMDLYLAPSKGGIFTTHERDVIKTKLPRIVD